MGTVKIPANEVVRWVRGGVGGTSSADCKMILEGHRSGGGVDRGAYRVGMGDFPGHPPEKWGWVCPRGRGVAVDV